MWVFTMSNVLQARREHWLQCAMATRRSLHDERPLSSPSLQARHWHRLQQAASCAMRVLYLDEARQTWRQLRINGGGSRRQDDALRACSRAARLVAWQPLLLVAAAVTSGTCWAYLGAADPTNHLCAGGGCTRILLVPTVAEAWQFLRAGALLTVALSCCMLALLTAAASGSGPARGTCFNC